MAYATFADVAARAGRLAAAWTDDSDPDVADLEILLENTAAEIDALVAGRGYSLPLDETASGALVSLNADMVLILAIEGTFGGADVGTEVESILKGARERVKGGLSALTDGKHAVFVYLGSTAAAASADDFWSTEPEYGMLGSRDKNEALVHPGVQPGAYRNQRY